MGQKVSGEVANAIRGALIDAKLSLVPVRTGWWGARFGAPHTVPCKVTGKCGSVTFRVIPAPKGTGIVAAKTPKKLLVAAGYQVRKNTKQTMEETQLRPERVYRRTKFVHPPTQNRARMRQCEWR